MMVDKDSKAGADSEMFKTQSKDRNSLLVIKEIYQLPVSLIFLNRVSFPCYNRLANSMKMSKATHFNVNKGVQ